MRIDLSLQRLQFQILDLAAMFYPFFHQSVHLIHHLIKTPHQLRDFVVAGGFQSHRHISLFHGLHGFGKLRNTLQGGLADQICQQIGGQSYGYDNGKHLQAQLAAQPEDVPVRQNAGNMPTGGPDFPAADIIFRAVGLKCLPCV